MKQTEKAASREENTDMDRDTKNKVTCSHVHCTCHRNMFGRMIILRAITTSAPGTTEKKSGKRMKYKKLPFNFTLYDAAAAVRCAYVFLFFILFHFLFKIMVFHNLWPFLYGTHNHTHTHTYNCVHEM